MTTQVSTTGANKNNNLFSIDQWWWLNYDGRKNIFKGITREEFAEMKEKAIQRQLHKAWLRDYKTVNQRRRELIAYFAEIPYKYDGEGWEDYKKYQRPCSDGKGYVIITPGERGNNFYTDDKILVKYLTAKYNKHFNKK